MRYIAVVLLLTFLSGCSKEETVVGPRDSLIERINSARPYTLINVTSISSGTAVVYEKSDNPSPANVGIIDSYAIEGFLVIETRYGNKYHNLDLAKQVDILRDNPLGGSIMLLRYE